MSLFNFVYMLSIKCLNKLTAGEEGGIGGELSTRLTENQETQLRFAASRNAEPLKGVTISWLLLEQKSDRSISIKKGR